MSEYVKITTDEVLDVCNGKLICGSRETVFDNFNNDTRTIKPGEIYVGVKGTHHNGNDLYEDALQKGAKACILQDIIIPDSVRQKYADRTIIIVKDTIQALQRLALFKRNLYNIPVVAVTGSVGKTSTKDIIASVMSKKYHVLKTEGNFNSQLGLPLTILRLKDHDAMVVELGMNHLGEISKLTNIAKPTIAVITNVGTAHIGLLGSRENILKAKLEILDGLQNDGKIVINNDNDLLHEWCRNASSSEYDIITYGMENVSSFMAYNTKLDEEGSSYNIDVKGTTYHVNVPVGGKHFISNSLCAIAVGRLLDIDMVPILDGIASFELTKRRMQVEKLDNGIIVINDCYNANYDSMKAAIEYLGKLPSSHKIAVLGDMMELGEYEEEFHRKVGEEVAKNGIDILITVGPKAQDIAKAAKDKGMLKENIFTYQENLTAIIKIQQLIKKDTAILIKASNIMNFEEIFQSIIKKEEEK